MSDIHIESMISGRLCWILICGAEWSSGEDKANSHPARLPPGRNTLFTNYPHQKFYKSE